MNNFRNVLIKNVQLLIARNDIIYLNNSEKNFFYDLNLFVKQIIYYYYGYLFLLINFFYLSVFIDYLLLYNLLFSNTTIFF